MRRLAARESKKKRRARKEGGGAHKQAKPDLFHNVHLIRDLNLEPRRSEVNILYPRQLTKLLTDYLTSPNMGLLNTMTYVL